MSMHSPSNAQPSPVRHSSEQRRVSPLQLHLDQKVHQAFAPVFKEYELHKIRTPEGDLYHSLPRAHQELAWRMDLTFRRKDDRSMYVFAHGHRGFKHPETDALATSMEMVQPETDGSGLAEDPTVALLSIRPDRVRRYAMVRGSVHTVRQTLNEAIGDIEPAYLDADDYGTPLSSQDQLRALLGIHLARCHNHEAALAQLLKRILQ